MAARQNPFIAGQPAAAHDTQLLQQTSGGEGGCDQKVHPLIGTSSFVKCGSRSKHLEPREALRAEKDTADGS